MVGKFTSLLVLVAVVAYGSALTATPFEKLTDGIWDVWNSTNPDLVRGSIGVQTGHDLVWLVSRRTYRKNANESIDTASRGGIVSTFNVATKSWTHKTYDRLDTDENTDKLFSLQGRLFMLTYNTKRNKINYHKLFFWDDKTGRWFEMQFDIDLAATTTSTDEKYQYLSITVPDQAGNMAYVVPAAYNEESTHSAEIVYCKLEIEFRSDVPMQASVKVLHSGRSEMRLLADVSSGIRFVATKGNNLIAFIDKFFKQWYGSENTYAYLVDMDKDAITKFYLKGSAPPMDFDFDIYQNGNEVFLVGGDQDEGSREYEMAIDVNTLNLNTLDWQGSNIKFQDEVGWSTVFDQIGKKLYVVGLYEGISVSQIS